MKAFSNDIINGVKTGYTGKAFTDVVKYWYWRFRFRACHGGGGIKILSKSFKTAFCE